MTQPSRHTAGRTPARRDRTPAFPDPRTTDGPSPVQVRLMGNDAAVRRLVAALQEAAACGPASYRPMRGSDGTRAYLDIVVAADPAS
ncbi:hypothetical protein [Streptomyces acidiscabies]|uniref:Uncharacterized protein n=1 Tax=Streptomyces acidiscabies TaxID=42234 RepID=A0ABU4M995_9ACTN|nr:hypothetical protein [Streptomyces acidiscabies]MDX3024054.1 hypothetical protein [Streptomyces acidiscabies]